ncbi:pyridine nucleotide-disulfide oxidoreductase [methane-oxidizing endosymbiont of Gigantopelta aegis]|uniref:pyridine nucleotide-disulfide oxidoreductase n=1 Tax=methane-oxidizing endosymbiont of Gigantopelta aegis TaxID=2794938 RepID=UPI0018DCF24B|nr:pyridine nucleotide-disulfide oxidoreductase [methane-oxidizing endosymbiont of Gigantopelta aegis]
MTNSENNISNITLGLPGFSYSDLYQPEKLELLLKVFDDSVKRHDSALFSRYLDYRETQGKHLKPEEISDILVEMGPYVGQFVAKLFNVEQAHQNQADIIRHDIETVFFFRQQVVSKLAKKFRKENIADWKIENIKKAVVLMTESLVSNQSDQELAISEMGADLFRFSQHFSRANEDSFSENSIAKKVAPLRDALAGHDKASQFFADALGGEDSDLVNTLLDYLERWLYIANTDIELQVLTKNWTLFKVPEKTDFTQLVETEEEQRDGFVALVGPKAHRRRRDGFALTDKRFNQREVLYEVDHCIYCHDRDTDSCSKGMKNKKNGTFKINPLNVPVIGCPLEEKISEMHLVKRRGDNIGALAIIMIDNPMCPGTGHRICNDCMRGCIYQKTEPVNIPQIETNVLTDVLFMPYGFEIYSFLTRWNPLNIRRPYALPYNGKNILVAGLGPAGYTLAHYLVNEGFGVVGIDGLKIEPLPEDLVGSDTNPPVPVRDFNDLYEDLDKRILAGFGGVAEYGITVRWDKNFLKVIYLTLARRNTFKAYGGIRFGGTVTIEDAWEMGFDHIAMAVGAGKPTIIGLKNNLVRGIRKASDFLMGLQLTGAAKTASMANLQVRLPAGVIGGGLTATDTATELLAYYPVQVEKILKRYEILAEKYGEEAVLARFDEEEKKILEEFLGHGQAIRAERERAKRAGEAPDFQSLIDKWGGVTLFYRKGMKNAPAYIQNHEEIEKALEEGIAWAEGMNPKQALVDEYQHLKAVRFEKMHHEDGQWVGGEQIDVPLRSLYVAAGTSPNTIYQNEHPGVFEMDGNFFQRYQPEADANSRRLTPMDDTWLPKVGNPAPFTSYHKNGRYITYYGDSHPVYAGNVVKAMASAKDGYPYVVELFADEIQQLDSANQAKRDTELKKFQEKLDNAFLASIKEVKRLTPTIVEVIVKAPMQAKHFEPGQFYRLQNYETYAPIVSNTVLASEGIALTGAWVDKEQGLISLIALEMGSSTKLCRFWKAGDPVVLMGVTGTPTEIPNNKTVMLVGGGLGNAVLFSIGKAMRAAGNRVVYFAGYKHDYDVFKVEDIEAAADVIIWSVDPGEGVKPLPTTRPQDLSCIGNILESIERYAKGELGEINIPLNEVNEIIVIGSDRMMAAVKEARYGRLKPYLQEHKAIGSINSPMQCMMKGICAQCLCKHIDKETGTEFFVYSCFNQDQNLDEVDFPHLNARLRQNTVQEKLSSLWLDYLMDENEEAIGPAV